MATAKFTSETVLGFRDGAQLRRRTVAAGDVAALLAEVALGQTHTADG